MEVEEEIGSPVDLGGRHFTDGRRMENRRHLFEHVFTLHVVFKLYAENDKVFSVSAEAGKFRDLLITFSDREFEGTSFEVVKLNHSHSEEISEIHFSPGTGTFCFKDILSSFRRYRQTVDHYRRLTVATNRTLDDSVAGNFHQAEHNRLLGEVDTWALREDSKLLGGVVGEDLRAFRSVFRLATGVPDEECLKGDIIRRLGEMYGEEGYSEMRLKQFYLHIKRQFEDWCSKERQPMTFEIMKGLLNNAQAALDT